MVGAVFGLALAPLVPGDEVHTMFGKFTADEVRSEPDRSFALLSTWAPGSTSRFALEARRCSGGVWEAVLTNSVHPSGWIGRAYFRAIQVGHEVVMRVALRRLARVAGPATGSPGP